jgi:hypothetical protein
MAEVEGTGPLAVGQGYKPQLLEECQRGCADRRAASRVDAGPLDQLVLELAIPVIEGEEDPAGLLLVQVVG